MTFIYLERNIIMNSENIHFYLSVLAPILTLLCTTVVFLQKFVKNKKLKKVLEKTEEITKEMIPCIRQAEQFVHYSGAEKKEYVMTKLKQFAIDHEIKFDEEETSKRIEELVTLTKKVNVKPTSVEEEINSDSKQQIELKIKNIIEKMRE